MSTNVTIIINGRPVEVEYRGEVGYETPDEEWAAYGCKPDKCAGCLSKGLPFCMEVSNGS